MIELIGLVGATAFALSGVPQAIKSCREGHSRGMASGTVALWLTGEGAMLAYALVKYASDYVLLGNYLANFLVVGVIAWFKVRPRSPDRRLLAFGFAGDRRRIPVARPRTPPIV